MKKLGSGIAVTAFLPAFTFCDSNSRTILPEGNYNINPGFSPDVDVELKAIQCTW